VAAGDTLHIEYLYGTSTQYQLTKLGAGRLEVAIFGSEKVHVAVSNGTFAVVLPQRMSFADDEQVTYHADATMSDSMTFTELNGTNFVAEWRDADGKAHLKAVPHSTRPKPFVSADGINGLPVVDFGTLQNAGGSGYGASLVWEWAAESVGRTNICEYYFAWMDDPDAKNHTGSYRGPCIFGVANASSTVLSGVLTRDLCGNGLTASIHPQSLMGRLQGNNYLDGSIQPGNPQRFYRVPDGPHVFYQWTSEERYPVLSRKCTPLRIDQRLLRQAEGCASGGNVSPRRISLAMRTIGVHGRTANDSRAVKFEDMGIGLWYNFHT
jgi:hypothetical protein